jgi:predicted amidophosphoribosyltransferase
MPRNAKRRKKCGRCGQYKPAKWFETGLEWCNDCVKEYDKIHCPSPETDVDEPDVYEWGDTEGNLKRFNRYLKDRGCQ